MAESKTIKEILERHPRWRPFSEPGKCKGCGIADTNGDWAPGHDAKAKRSSRLADPGTLVGQVILCGSNDIDLSSGHMSRSNDPSTVKGAQTDEMVTDSPGAESASSSHPTNCLPFTDIVMVDWSANKTSKSGKDSIWIAHLQIDPLSPPGTLTLCNPETRREAYELLDAIIKSVLNTNNDPNHPRRVLIGLDFAFGLPRSNCTSAMKCLWEGMPYEKKSPHGYRARDVWSFAGTQVIDCQAKNGGSQNNRFSLAWALNYLMQLGGWASSDGIFYLMRSTSLLGKQGINVSKFPKRLTENVCKTMMKSSGAMPVWQLDGPGAVGSQTLMGWPTLSRLCQMDDVEVWPFDTGWSCPRKDVVIVEIFPSLITTCIGGFGQLGRTCVSSTTAPSGATVYCHNWTTPLASSSSTATPLVVAITCEDTANPWNNSGYLEVDDAYQVASCALAVWDKQVSSRGLTDWFTLSTSTPRPTVDADEGWIFGVP